jgi:hypothetical protein
MYIFDQGVANVSPFGRSIDHLRYQKHPEDTNDTAVYTTKARHLTGLLMCIRITFI